MRNAFVLNVFVSLCLTGCSEFVGVKTRPGFSLRPACVCCKPSGCTSPVVSPLIRLFFSGNVGLISQKVVYLKQESFPSVRWDFRARVFTSFVT